MLPIKIEIPEKVAIELDPDNKDWRRALRAGYAAITQLWRDVFLCKHFLPDAKGKYRYQPRTRGYLKRKMAMAKIGKVRENGLVDLVFTGRMRDNLQSTVRLSSSYRGGSVTMTGPRYITMVPYNSNQPDKAKEVLAVTSDEIDQINQVLDNTIKRVFYGGYSA
jgi:hypothetical protein